jgi:hypothetical protein
MLPIDVNAKIYTTSFLLYTAQGFCSFRPFPLSVCA